MRRTLAQNIRFWFWYYVPLVNFYFICFSDYKLIIAVELLRAVVAVYRYIWCMHWPNKRIGVKAACVLLFGRCVAAATSCCYSFSFLFFCFFMLSTFCLCFFFPSFAVPSLSVRAESKNERAGEWANQSTPLLFERMPPPLPSPSRW